TTLAWKAAQEDGKPLGKFCVHDLRRTASTLLHEAGYNTDWIEKCLAHEQKGVRAIYNKAEYAEQRRVMLQDWADMIDRWVKGDPALWAVVPPPSSPLSMLRPPSSPMPLIAE
ncbi:MAG: tyrosine-type recombinase/integrase, partial [Halothiobacillaceae bacterium]